MNNQDSGNKESTGKSVNHKRILKFIFSALSIVAIIGIVALLAQPFARLIMSVFGFFEGLLMIAQSIFVGPTGKCIPKEPNIKCGDKNQYQGAECCTGVSKDGVKFAAGVGNCAGKNPKDEKSAVYTCDHDDTMCCGCVNKGTNPCPNGKPLYKEPIVLAIIFSGIGVLLLGGLASLAKAFTGRDAKQAANTVEDSKKRAASDLPKETKKSLVKIDDKANRETLSPEQQQAHEALRDAEARAQVASEEARAAEKQARDNPSDENKEKEEAAREEEAKAKQEVIERANEFPK